MNKLRRIKLTIFLGFLAALAPLSTDMYLSALPRMQDAFAVDTSVIQLTLSMTMLGMALGQLFAGPISDRFGRKIPLVTGMIFFTLATVGCVISRNITVFLALRFIQGLSGAFGIVIARAIARDVCTGAELTKFFSMLMLVNGLAPILAPVIGGQVLLVSDWHGIFVVLGIIGALLLASSIRFSETLPERLRVQDILSSFKNFHILMSDKYFLGHCLVQCTFFGAFFAYISGSSFLFQNIYQISPQAYSLIFGGVGAAIALAGTIPIRLAGKVSELKMMTWSICQALVGAICIMLCVLFDAPIELMVISFLIMVPMTSILGATSFSLAMKNHGREAGSASALMGFFQMLSAGIVTPLVGIAGSDTAVPMATIILLGEALTLTIFLKTIHAVHNRVPRVS